MAHRREQNMARSRTRLALMNAIMAFLRESTKCVGHFEVDGRSTSMPVDSLVPSDRLWPPWSGDRVISQEFKFVLYVLYVTYLSRSTRSSHQFIP